MKNNKSLLLLSILALSITSCNKGSMHYKFNEEVDNDELVEVVHDSTSSFTRLYENEKYVYSFKEYTDVLQIYDKENDYYYKTGIDMPPYSEDEINDLPRNERKEFYKNNPFIEYGMVNTYIAMANSLVTLQVYSKDGANYSSAYYGTSLSGVSSVLNKVKNEQNHYKLVVDYNECKERALDIQLKVDLYFNEQGFEIKVLDQNITGKDSILIRNILIAPYMGATGGQIQYFDTETGSVDRLEDKEMKAGYAFVPDGSGSLIEFKNNETSGLSSYQSNVYGVDKSHSTSYSSTKGNVTTIKDAKMPVYGVAYTDDRKAFVAYAKSGAEYMAINMMPDNTGRVQYNRIFPTFAYNFEYSQVYNKAGASYSKIADERNHFTLDMQFDFLANENANYVGMALDYRNYLISSGTLHEVSSNYTDIPLRMDFIMSDTESALVGNKTIVSTKINDLTDDLVDAKENLGINNAIVSLQGWQQEGKTLQNPSKANFANKTGSAVKYNSLIKKLNDMNYETSLVENYYYIHTGQMAYLNNASKHINGYYNEYHDNSLKYKNDFALAKANRSYDFVVSQNKKLQRKVKNLSNMTIEGISEYLSSHEDSVSRLESEKYIQNAFSYLKDKNYKVNAINPNQYLWSYVDRYFNIDAYDSALLIESETVPFIQLVLNNTMELYSNYCNISFYDDLAICKMIDYNIYPSFILSHESAYDLLTTNSCIYFSTQYSYQRNLIQKIYQEVNGALGNVINATWTNRVKENNVVTNYYSNGKKIVINYNNNVVTIDGKEIQALSWEVM